MGRCDILRTACLPRPVGRTVVRSLAATILLALLSVSATGGAEPADADVPADRDTEPGVAGTIVSEVRVTGNQAISTAWIVASIKTAIGKPFDPGAMGADTKKLMRSGFFNSVKMRREPQSDGTVTVVIEVTEGRLLRYLKIEGSTKSEKLLAKKAGLKVGEPFDAAIVERARHRLEQYLHSKSLADAKVTILEGDEAEDRGVRLHVEEGEKVTSGFGIGMSATRRNAKPITMTFKGGFDEDRIDKYSQKLVAHYRSLGYLQARARREPTSNEDNRMASFDIVVDEGPRFVITKVALAGNLAFSDEELNEVLRPQPNMQFEKTAVDEMTKRLRDAYLAAGYLFPTIRTRQLFPENVGEVELLFEIAEGHRFRAGRIECHLAAVDADRKQLLMKTFPLAKGDLVAAPKITEWAVAHGAVFDVMYVAGREFKALLRPVLQPDPTPDQLRFGESIEIELIPSTGVFADEAVED